MSTSRERRKAKRAKERLDKAQPPINCRACRQTKPRECFDTIKGRIYERCFECREKIKIEDLYIRDKGICYLCGNKVLLRDASVDHVIPLSLGGIHDYSNTALTHQGCNCKKATTAPWEMTGFHVKTKWWKQ